VKPSQVLTRPFTVVTRRFSLLINIKAYFQAESLYSVQYASRALYRVWYLQSESNLTALWPHTHREGPLWIHTQPLSGFNWDANLQSCFLLHCNPVTLGHCQCTIGMCELQSCYLLHCTPVTLGHCLCTVRMCELQSCFLLHCKPVTLGHCLCTIGMCELQSCFLLHCKPVTLGHCLCTIGMCELQSCFLLHCKPVTFSQCLCTIGMCKLHSYCKRQDFSYTVNCQPFKFLIWKTNLKIRRSLLFVWARGCKFQSCFVIYPVHCIQYMPPTSWFLLWNTVQCTVYDIIYNIVGTSLCQFLAQCYKIQAWRRSEIQYVGDGKNSVIPIKIERPDFSCIALCVDDGIFRHQHTISLCHAWLL
jgi:hypothetical protein